MSLECITWIFLCITTIWSSLESRHCWCVSLCLCNTIIFVAEALLVWPVWGCKVWMYHYTCTMTHLRLFNDPLHQRWGVQVPVFWSSLLCSCESHISESSWTPKPHGLQWNVLSNRLQMASPPIKPTAELFNCHYHNSICVMLTWHAVIMMQRLSISKVPLYFRQIVAITDRKVHPYSLLWDKSRRGQMENLVSDHRLWLYRTFGSTGLREGSWFYCPPQCAALRLINPGFLAMFKGQKSALSYTHTHSHTSM